MKLDETINAKDAWLKQVKHHRRRLKGLPRVGFNPNAGNVEYNISMMNKMLGSGEMLSNNPVSGPFGGDVSAPAGGIGESLNIETNLLENIDMNDNKVRKAVGVLFDMDHFVLSVMDNMYWLSMGVPDGEFDETDRHAAEVNFADHDWLIVDDDKFDTEAFEDLIIAFEEATEGADDYNQEERKAIIDEARSILNMNESYDEDEFEVDERYFVYDENDNCVSDGFKYEEDAIKKAEGADYPVVKVHTYFYDERGKLRPYDDPKIVWLGGEYFEESYDKDGNPERCTNCNTLLNDSGTCPRCDDGEEDFEHNDTLTEAPSWLNFRKPKTPEEAQKNKEASRNKETTKLIKNLGKLLAPAFSDTCEKCRFIVNGKVYTQPEYEKLVNASTITKILSSGNLLAADPNSADMKMLANAIDTVIIDENGQIIRRGLEDLSKGSVYYIRDRSDLTKIQDKYSSKAIFSRSLANQEKAETSSTQPTAEKPANAAEQSANANAPSVEKSEPVKPAQGDDSWITDDAVKVAVNLLARRKDGAAVYYDAEGNPVSYKDVKAANAAELYLDKELTKPFMDTLRSIKTTMGERKEAAIQRAAVFGESYDDTMQYEEFDEVELDEGLSTAEFEELMDIANEIGLKTTGDMVDFVNREHDNNESPLDTFRRYRDDLGDDFELNENYEESPMSVVEDTLDESVDVSWYN